LWPDLLGDRNAITHTHAGSSVVVNSDVKGHQREQERERFFQSLTRFRLRLGQPAWRATAKNNAPGGMHVDYDPGTLRRLIVAPSDPAFVALATQLL